MTLLEKTFNIGIGMVATVGDSLSMEKVGPVLDKLAARGESARAEGCACCEEFKAKRKENLIHMRDLCHSEKEYWMSCKDKYVDRAQYDELLARVQKIEATI